MRQTGAMYLDPPTRKQLWAGFAVISLGLALTGLLALGILGCGWESVQEHESAKAITGWGIAGVFSTTLACIFLEAWLKSAITLVANRRFKYLVSSWLTWIALISLSALLLLGVITSAAAGAWSGVAVCLMMLAALVAVAHSLRGVTELGSAVPAFQNALSVDMVPALEEARLREIAAEARREEPR